MVMKSYVCENVLFDESLKRLQDWDYILQVYLAGYNIEYLNEILVETNDSLNSITKTINSKDAYEMLIKKYRKYYEKYPKSLAYVYMLIARSLKNSDRKEAEIYLIKSYKQNHNLKTILKIILNKFNLWK